MEYLVLNIADDSLVDVIELSTPKLVSKYEKEHPEHYLTPSVSLEDDFIEDEGDFEEDFEEEYFDLED